MNVLKICLPYILVIIFIPIYQFLDNNFFVDILGCGCVPIAQNNMLNIPFNANDLKLVIYVLFSIAMLLLQLKFTKHISNKGIRVAICVTTLIFNISVQWIIYQLTMWM